jgi:hypothetical protein
MQLLDDTVATQKVNVRFKDSQHALIGQLQSFKTTDISRFRNQFPPVEQKVENFGKHNFV